MDRSRAITLAATILVATIPDATIPVATILVATIPFGATSAAAEGELTIRFIGNAAFELSDGETTLVTDFPYAPGAYGYMEYGEDAAPVASDSMQVTAVITHGHKDHFDAKRFLTTGWRLVAPAEVVSALPKTIEVDVVEPVNDVFIVGAFTIEHVATAHRDVDHVSLRIGWRGRHLYFTGDTESPTHLVEEESLDVAFVTPWLLCLVAERGASIDAERIVLHHQFPGGRSRVCGEPTVLEQGASFTLTAAG